MNMSITTNLVALVLTIGGYLSPVHSDLIFSIGIFALSGSITNWLAVHMLFEKVPLLYGSGVIPNRFEDFKAGIKALLINEFFNRDQIARFIQGGGDAPAQGIIEKVDFNRVFEGLTQAIEQSQMGGMLSMIGGKKALEPLREPVTRKLKDIITELGEEGMGLKEGPDLADVLVEKAEHIIDARLDELTPENVKIIVQDMIRKHLGWLVVWGGVFGGGIGACVGVLNGTGAL